MKKTSGVEVAPPHKSLKLLTLFTLHVEYTLLKLQQFWPYMRFMERRQPRRIKHHDVVQCSQRGSRSNLMFQRYNATMHYGS